MPETGADPGFRDPDHSPSFDGMVTNLDYFAASPYVKKARQILRQVLRARPGMRLLDAGSGTGGDVAAMAGRVAPDGHVVGMDVSARMTELAKSRHASTENVSFETGDLRRIDYPDGYFDASWSMRTVQYLDHPLAGIRELVRVTRGGGRVVLIEGGLAATGLADSALTRYVFGPRAGGIGMRLPLLMREAGLKRIVVKPAFAFEIGKPDPKILEYATSQALNGVSEGVATQAEADEWLEELTSIVEQRQWVAAECMFVVAGVTSPPAPLFARRGG